MSSSNKEQIAGMAERLLRWPSIVGPDSRASGLRPMGVRIPLPAPTNPFRKSVDGKGIWRNRVVFEIILRLMKTRISKRSVTKFRNDVTIFRNIGYLIAIRC